MRKGGHVEIAGRRGVVCWDGRPEHEYIMVRWDDTGEESEVIEVSEVSPVSPKITGTPRP